MQDGQERAGGGPLQGIRIVEFAGIGPGPYASMLLADMGADIIRLDRPGGSDSFVHHVFQRGRPTITVDLKDPTTRDQVLDLLAEADGLIEGFRPGVMERLGLGPDAVHARNPKLVYGRMTGWGQTGPLSQVAGHDINYIAITGALAAIGPREKPAIPLNLLGDFAGGSMFLVCGMLAAFLHAKATGEGQVVDAAICDGTLSLMAMFSALMAQGDWRLEREANMLDGGLPYYRTFECADGKFLSVGALEDKFYDELCRLTGFAGHDRAEKADWPAQHAAWEALFRTRSRDEWSALLEKADACVAPVLDFSEATDHPHIAERQALVEVDGVVQPAPAPRFSRTPGSIRAIADEQRTLAGEASRWRA